MLKPYTRNQRKTDYIIDKWNEIYSNILCTVLKDKDTLYEIQDIPNNIQYTKLKSITGIDNVVIVIDELNEDIHFIDKKHGYSVEYINNNAGLNLHLVGLYNYVLTPNDRGYIIKTNYNSVDELITKFGIGVSHTENNYYVRDVEVVRDVAVVLPYGHASTDDIWTISYPIYPMHE